MRELFGIPMGTLAVMLALSLAVAVGVLATLALRNRVLLRLGARNVGRRRARTALIVSGLMLGTTIITAALATGDTMSHTIRTTAIGALGSVDERVSAQGAGVDPGLEEAAGTVRSGWIDAAAADEVRRAVGGSPLVDGVAPAIVQRVAVAAPRTRQNEPRVGLFASDPSRLGGFGPILREGGGEVSLADLRAGEAYLTADAADDLGARAGDPLRVMAGGRAALVRVRAVVAYDGTGADEGAVLMGLPAAQRLLGRPGRINHVLVSNRGDDVEGAELTDEVVARLGPVADRLGLRVETVKRDAIEAADEAGSAFLAFFTTFGSFSIAAGVLLIFLIFVMLAAERRAELGIARAVGTRRGHLVEMFTFEGVLYDVVAAAVGVLLGIAVAYGMVLMIADAFAGEGGLDVAFAVSPRSMVVAYCVGVLLTLAVVALSARRVSRMNIVTAIRNLPEPAVRSRRRRRFLLPALGLAVGAALTASAASSRDGVAFDIGTGLVILALVALAGALGVPDRAARTVGGLVLVAWFTLPMGEWLIGDLVVDFSVFIVAGLLIIVGATWVILYNAAALQAGVARLMRHMPRVAPAAKLAMAYPLQSLFRTGVTLAMFTLVVFTMVVGATVTSAFTNAFDDLETWGGGFDVRASTAPASPIRDLDAALAAHPRLAREVVASGSQSVVPVEARQRGAGRAYEDYLARGLDRGFLDHTTYGFATMARGYDSAREVWRALERTPGLAVVDALAAPRRSNFTFGALTDFRLSGFSLEDERFDPVPVEVADPAGGPPLRLTVIGVLSDAAPYEMAGLWTSQATLAGRFGDLAAPSLHLLSLRPGADATATAAALEATLSASGVEADALADELDEAVAENRTFNLLVQAFMALGLLVGVAALGVISARSVVERRQQIGVLRAIGFRRRLVQATFLLESSFVAVTAIALGTGLGLMLAYTIIRDSQRQPSWSNLSFDVPWLNLAVVFATVYVVAMATTLLPARRAARISPAEALRYE
ncbi:ABC transporter permease [Miltoncostaea marina]|uniref:ABC transporter permease n=1 Tax=Miltoncostaea marina TaxID=2843215 RepID=UPI001C3DCE70|nr:FtsX-like permease family protein [Miltoncostaea marina]